MLKLITKMFGSVVAGGPVMWAVLGAVVVVLGYITALNLNINSLEKDIIEYESQVKTLGLDIMIAQANVRNCQNKVSDSNSRLEDLNATGSAREQIIDMLGDTIEIQRDATVNRTGNIRDIKIGETCEDAMAFLRDGASDIK